MKAAVVDKQQRQEVKVEAWAQKLFLAKPRALCCIAREITEHIDEAIPTRERERERETPTAG
jgi:hypothetical protein